jgi:suppressor of fused protein SUFU
MTMNVVEHLESFCGPIAEGWKKDPDGKEMPFQIVRLESGPIAGTVTFSTLGLSFHPLKSATSSKTIRHELVMLVRADDIPKNLGPILQEVAAESISRGYAYLRGEVIGPRGSLFLETELMALYVANPVYFPDDFFGATTDQLGRVVFACLIPITAHEANYVAANGWTKFEDMLLRADPDLLDLRRHSIV